MRRGPWGEPTALFAVDERNQADAVSADLGYSGHDGREWVGIESWV